MKTSFFIIALSFLTSLSLSAFNTQHEPYVKVVVTPQRILLITDETPIAPMLVEVKNAEGKVVLEKLFSSKSTDWTLCIANLPAGNYSVSAGDKVTRFVK